MFKSTDLIWDHLYITSAKGLGRWVTKIAIFADVQYCIYANLVSGSKKVQTCAEVIYGWSLAIISWYTANFYPMKTTGTGNCGVPAGKTCTIYGKGL